VSDLPCVQIRARASRQLGIGHASRCRSLGLALLARGIQARVLLSDSDGLAGAFDWGQLEVSTVNSGGPRLAATDWPRLGGCRVLVNDDPLASESDASLDRAAGHALLVNMAMAAANSYPSDLFVNGYVPAPGVSVAATRQCTGPEYQIIRPEVVAARPSNPQVPEHLDRALVVMGGTDPAALSVRVAESLQRVGIEPLVALGPGCSRRTRIKLLELAIRFVEEPKSAELVSLMSQSDLVVTQGGLTAAEALCLGRPVICIRWQHLAPLVDSLEALGLVWIPSADSSGFSWAGLQDGWWRDATDRAFKLFDGRGADRVVDAVLRW
jgi:spore coat polysaccharide biosynthesis predicted glycosyltransferase SpsG